MEMSDLWNLREKSAKLSGMLEAMKEISDQNKEKQVDLSCALENAADLADEIKDDAKELQEMFESESEEEE